MHQTSCPIPDRAYETLGRHAADGYVLFIVTLVAFLAALGAVVCFTAGWLPGAWALVITLACDLVAFRAWFVWRRS